MNTKYAYFHLLQSSFEFANINQSKNKGNYCVLMHQKSSLNALGSYCAKWKWLHTLKCKDSLLWVVCCLIFDFSQKDFQFIVLWHAWKSIWPYSLNASLQTFCICSIYEKHGVKRTQILTPNHFLLKTTVWV